MSFVLGFVIMLGKITSLLDYTIRDLYNAGTAIKKCQMSYTEVSEEFGGPSTVLFNHIKERNLLI